MTDFTKLLNPEQCAAATAGEGPILVLAAAGTGKTRTLVHRVAYLVEKGVRPDRILLLTFTNRAAREMIERAIQTVGPGVSSIWSGTFHSICAKFLRRWGSALGYKPSFQIIDEDEKKKLLGEIIKSTVSSPQDFPKKDVLAKIISEAANEGKSVEFVASRWLTKAAGIEPEEIARVAAAYYERKRQMGVMDFDDLLINGLRLLKEHARVREILQEHFLHVLVDEYQDTNGLQAEFTDILAAKHRNIMAVGDDFQCIYTWRGAQIANILDFPSRWQGCRTVKLERNYRSLPQILSVANAVMRDAPAQFQKTLRPTRSESGARPTVYRIYNARMQAAQIVSLIQQAIAQGWRKSDIAVLYRAHFHSIDIEKAISAAQIPYRLTSGIGFYEKEHVKDILAFLRLMIDPASELSFLRFIRLLPGIGEAGAAKLWSRLGKDFSLSSTSDRARLTAIIGSKPRTLWMAIDSALSADTAKIERREWGGVVMSFVDAFYEDYIHNAWEGEEAEERIDDIQELASDLAEENRPLEEYLGNIALMTNLDIRRNNPSMDRVTLSTVHQAKGMEWPVVFIPWMSEGMFPSARAQEDGRVEEERRLFYVAVTRAKDTLTFFSPQVRRSPEGGEYPVAASPFLYDIPKELLSIRKIDEYGFTNNGYGGGYTNRYDARGVGFGGGGGSFGGGGRFPSSSSSFSSHSSRSSHAPGAPSAPADKDPAFVPTKRSVAEYKKLWRS